MVPLLPVLVCALVAAAARAAPEDCGLPKERGSCTQFAVRYYYDTEYGGCLRFWYGGCDGNGNRFETESECERTCVTPGGDDLCRLPAVRGACKRSKTRWYSDPASGGCRQFTYSGCLGNDNRFETESACQQRCGRVTSDYGTGGSGGGTSGGAPATTAAPGPTDCLLPDRVAGDCRKYVIRYSYVAARQQCAPFYYGGCGGNANRFDTAEACRAACSKPTTTRPPYYLPPRERAPPAGGGYPRYGYGGPDRPEGRVRPTEPSRRSSEPERRAPDTTEPTAAADICSLPALPGKCRAYFPRYYFNTRSQRCERFVYGGCQGNENNFETLADCEKRCGRPSQPPYSRERDRAAPTQPSRRPDQPETEAPYVPYRPQTEAPYVPYRPQTEAPYVPYRPETEAPYVPYRPGTEAPYVPYRPETEAPTVPESAIVDATEPTDICSLPAQAGECRAYIRMYYFNARSQRCETFVYGGCGGNQNSFQSLAECEYRCGGTAHPEVQPTEAPLPETEPPQTEVPDAYIALPTAAEPDVCGLPPTAGPCDQRLQRYYFNAPLGSCFTFTYSGCGGNGNRFESATECRARCQPGEPEVTYAPFPTFTVGGGDGAGVETTTSGEYPTYDYLTSDYPEILDNNSLEYYYNYEYE